jgi:hypothetical protein
MKLTLTRFSLLQFLKENFRDPWTYRISPIRLLRFWMRGFKSEHILIYDLQETNWRHYMPDIFRYRVSTRSNFHVWPILHDKLVFDAFMRDRLPVIAALFYMDQGRFNRMLPGYDLDVHYKEVREGKRFVIKPAQGGAGKGLLFVRGGEREVEVNGRGCSQAEYRALVEKLDCHLCYPMMESHEAMKRIFPGSSNALRVTAFVGLDGKPRLLAPVFCIGTVVSAPIEHFWSGGLVARINEATGVCEQAARRGADGRLEPITHHPDTGEAIVGVAIPHWQSLRDQLLRFHSDHPAFDLVGWDVLIGQDAFHIVEGNHNPALRIPLMNRNLSEEPEFRAFLEKRGIL